jgi:hypothetical protein
MEAGALPPRPEPEGGGGLLLELIFPCRADCTESGHACADTARSDAVADFSTTR